MWRAGMIAYNWVTQLVSSNDGPTHQSFAPSFERRRFASSHRTTGWVRVPVRINAIAGGDERGGTIPLRR